MYFQTSVTLICMMWKYETVLHLQMLIFKIYFRLRTKLFVWNVCSAL